MITRIVMLMLIATFALPVTSFTSSGETSQSPWTESAVAAKGKKHKKKDKKRDEQTNSTPQFTTVTRTVRGPVTQTFTETRPILIPRGAPVTSEGPASAYPSAITVSGFANGVITDVDLLLEDLTHEDTADIDILLSTGDGRRALVLSDVGRTDAVTNIDLTLDDEVPTSLPATGLQSGTFRPTNLTQPVTDQDVFAAPAPAPTDSADLSIFDGADPNGAWQLWVMDDVDGDFGAIGGWALRITAEVDIAKFEEQVPADIDQQPVAKAKKKDNGKKANAKKSRKGNGRR